MMAEGMAYVAQKPCGCHVAATMIDERWRDETANDVAEWVRAGLTVKHMSIEETRTILGRCIHKAAVTTHERLLLPKKEG